MARILTVYNAITACSIDSSGNVTSDAIPIGRSEFSALQVNINSATTDTYTNLTASFLVGINKTDTFVSYHDDENTDLTQICGVDSSQGSVVYNLDTPVAPFIKIRITSTTNNTITLDSVKFITDELN